METKIKEFFKTQKLGNIALVQKTTPWAFGDRYMAQNLISKYLVYTKDGNIDTVYKVKGNDRKEIYKRIV